MADQPSQTLQLGATLASEFLAGQRKIREAMIEIASTHRMTSIPSARTKCTFQSRAGMISVFGAFGRLCHKLKRLDRLPKKAERLDPAPQMRNDDLAGRHIVPTPRLVDQCGERDAPDAARDPEGRSEVEEEDRRLGNIFMRQVHEILSRLHRALPSDARHPATAFGERGRQRNHSGAGVGLRGRHDQVRPCRSRPTP